MDKMSGYLGEESNIPDSRRKLVLGVDSFGNITWFNRECEEFTHYIREDVVSRRFSDTLIPNSYIKQWREIFENVKNDNTVDEIILPILTKEGDELSVSWDTMTVGDKGEIVFVGTPVLNTKMKKENRSLSSKNNSDGKKKSVDNKPVKSKFTRNNIDDSSDKSFKTRRKIGFRRPKRPQDQQKINELKKIIRDLNKKIEELERDKKEIIQKMVKEVELFQKEKKEIFRDMNKQLEALKQEKEEAIKSLLKKNSVLEKEKKDLQRKYTSLYNSLMKKRYKNEEKEQARRNFEQNITRAIKNGTNFLIDCVGGKQKKEVFYKMAQELEKRRKTLDDIEKKLKEEADDLSKKKEEFKKWREKLEGLEEEIERRRMDLVKQEEAFENYIFSTLWSANQKTGSSEIKEKNTDIDIVDFNKIEESAAVIQRNILRQINRVFQEILGYSEEDVINKSLFDIIAPESLPQLRRYYLDRLKGEKDSSYEVVFLTKNGDRLPMEISTQPTIFNGEKADVLILTPIDEKLIMDN